MVEDIAPYVESIIDAAKRAFGFGSGVNAYLAVRRSFDKQLAKLNSAIADMREEAAKLHLEASEIIRLANEDAVTLKSAAYNITDSRLNAQRLADRLAEFVA